MIAVAGEIRDGHLRIRKRLSDQRLDVWSRHCHVACSIVLANHASSKPIRNNEPAPCLRNPPAGLRLQLLFIVSFATVEPCAVADVTIVARGSYPDAPFWSEMPRHLLDRSHGWPARLLHKVKRCARGRCRMRLHQSIAVAPCL